MSSNIIGIKRKSNNRVYFLQFFNKINLQTSVCCGVQTMEKLWLPAMAMAHVSGK
jgi:hypothetical protein